MWHSTFSIATLWVAHRQSLIQCLQVLGQFGITWTLAVEPILVTRYIQFVQARGRHWYQILRIGLGPIKVDHQHRQQRRTIIVQYFLEMGEVMEYALRYIEVPAGSDVRESQAIANAELHGGTLEEDGLDGWSPGGHTEGMLLELHQSVESNKIVIDNTSI